MTKPKLQDVAAKAGVSPTTVSRVLNNRGYISTATRDAVHEAMKELHYHPNAIARSLQEQKTRLVGLVFPTVANPFYGELAHRIQSYLADEDYKVILCNSEDHPELESRYLDMLLANQVDGLITGAHSDVVANAPELNAPLITIDRSGSDAYPNVCCDNFTGAFEATQHLIATGASNILHVTSTLASKLNSRQRGYESAMKAAGLEPAFLELGFSSAPEVQSKILSRYLSRHSQVDAVFASNDAYAAMVLRWAEARQLAVPADFQVIGFDGTPTAQAFLPQLATVIQPLDALARQAVDLLLASMDGRNPKDPQSALPNQPLPVTLYLGQTVRHLGA